MIRKLTAMLDANCSREELINAVKCMMILILSYSINLPYALYAVTIAPMSTCSRDTTEQIIKLVQTIRSQAAEKIVIIIVNEIILKLYVMMMHIKTLPKFQDDSMIQIEIIEQGTLNGHEYMAVNSIIHGRIIFQFEYNGINKIPKYKITNKVIYDNLFVQQFVIFNDIQFVAKYPKHQQEYGRNLSEKNSITFIYTSKPGMIKMILGPNVAFIPALTRCKINDTRDYMHSIYGVYENDLAAILRRIAETKIMLSNVNPTRMMYLKPGAVNVCNIITFAELVRTFCAFVNK